MRFFGALTLIFIFSCSYAFSLEGSARRSTAGFYPLWEGTGHTEAPGDAFLGTYSGHVGVSERVQIGVEPIHFIYRTPNLHTKVRIYRSESLSTGIQLGVFHLLERAGTSSFSPMYPTRLDNADFTVTLVPLSGLVSFHVTEWMEIHSSTTLLGIVSSGGIRNELFPAESVTVEFLPHGRHALLLHGIEVGFWKHDVFVTGASYRYRGNWVEFRLGYFYRFRSAGNQAGPLIGFGIPL